MSWTSQLPTHVTISSATLASFCSALRKLSTVSLDRRQFFQAMAAIPIAAAADSRSAPTHHWEGLDLEWTKGVPPLFCTAYIDPHIPSQRGQEGAVAKYPRAIVSQGGDNISRDWRNRVRALNPAIKLFAYQVVAEETTVPGPGHDYMRRVTDSRVTFPGGYVPTVEVQPGSRFRIFDPRSVDWQKSFIEACEVLMASDKCDGLYLDQCTVYARAARSPNVRAEMVEALSSTLDQVRRRMPSLAIVGNTSYDFQALNGELNENRPGELESEVRFRGHQSPELNLFQYLTSDAPDSSAVRTMAKLAIENRCLYGVTNNYQRVVLPRIFDEISAASVSFRSALFR